MADDQVLNDVANRLRVLSIQSTNASNSGHPTTCASIAEVMSVLFFDEMKQVLSDPRNASSDRLVLSKGHAAPILYAAWAVAGLFPEERLMDLRKIDCELEGHPTPKLEFVDVATGSLGQGLSCAAGMAYTAKHFDKLDYRVYCIMGDGEAAEGSVWEAMNFAQHYKLDNLVAIFDINRLGQSEATCLQHQMDVYKARCEAFGFHSIVVDGHCVKALKAAFAEARATKGKPTALILKTFKGRGIPGIEDQENWHGKPLGDKAAAAIQAIEGKMSNKRPSKVPMKAPSISAPATVPSAISLSKPPAYSQGEKVATRLAYGTAVAKLGEGSTRVIALDAETKNSTYADKFKKAHPDRFIECFIAEQNLVGVAVGCGTRKRTVPFVSTFAAFFTRAFDQLRMGAISQANVKCVGSHAGISIGEDGPSQMALEDIAMFRSIPGSLVFYPSDAVSTERACELAANYHGIVFIRTSRPATTILYPNDEVFEPGKCKIVRKSSSDRALVIGAGVTLHEALAAAETLAKEGVNIRVCDIFSVKPIDGTAILQNAAECGNNVIVVEDHYEQGGIGDAVAHVLAQAPGTKLRHLCVRGIPRSGPPSVLLDVFGISAKSIAQAVREI
ncbi:transketolase [Galendromus occidentalis]|uniref:transketolase n=1 Tax=Galendromus occidentalis TaxID=34638 RepID=A0AAJ6QV84_9ACAR|nr:transketolase [Galendromus occidentalis]